MAKVADRMLHDMQRNRTLEGPLFVQLPWGWGKDRKRGRLQLSVDIAERRLTACIGSCSESSMVLFFDRTLVSPSVGAIVCPRVLQKVSTCRLA